MALPNNKADLVLLNGVVATGVSSPVTVEAVVVSDGRIVFVGTTAGVDPWLGTAARVIDLKGRMVLPGFHDGHIHAIGGAIYEHCQIPLVGLATREALLNRVREAISEAPQRPDYFGIGWNYGAFPTGGPRREDLDALCSDRPVFLMSCDGHSAWVNSAALTRAAIDATTPDPPGGRIARDPLSGKPTGWLEEPPAFRLVLQHLFLPNPTRMKDEFARFFRRLSAEGITSLLQPGVELLAQEEVFQTLAALESEGKLPVRIVAGVTCRPHEGPDPVAALKEARASYRGKLFRVEAAKIFLDGVLESHTARLLEPYLDISEVQAGEAWSDEAFRKIVGALHHAGIQTHIHTIGDGAVRMALDGIESAMKPRTRQDLRHTLAHLDLTDEADLPRFRELGVVACFQPTWFHVSEEELRELESSLGRRRAGNLYLMKRFLDSGAVVTCGSDYPAGGGGFPSFRPLDGIEMAHTRRPLGDPQGRSYRPDQCVSRCEMIQCYTRRAAFQFHHENEVGSIQAGKLADLVVLDRNLFELPAHEIHKARVMLTFLQGREVYRDPSF